MRFGAAHDEIVVDGHVFTRSKLTRREFRFLRTVTVDALIKSGAVKRGVAA
jgi:hypothetical protein